MVLNRRLPRITARDVLSFVAWGLFIRRQGPKNLTGDETFAGAACLKRFVVIQRAVTNIAGFHEHGPERLPCYGDCQATESK